MPGHYIDIPAAVGEKSVRVGEGETFTKVAVLDGKAGLPFDHIIAEADSKVDICVIVLPHTDSEASETAGASRASETAVIDIPLTVDLVGEGAEVKLSGIYVCASDSKVKLSTIVRHRVPHCSSDQTFNGIAGGKSHFKFFGHIIVARDAQKTNASQSSHNLLLSPEARIDAKPQLEIYADDVKCSHGAAIGQLNEDEQFYLRSRGIPESEAKVLQMISFVAPVISGISDEALREKIHARVESVIRDLAETLQ